MNNSSWSTRLRGQPWLSIKAGNTLNNMGLHELVGQSYKRDAAS